MGKGQRIETRRTDYLGIVAGVSQEIGLATMIDKRVGKGERRVSWGQAVQAMVWTH